MSLGSWRLGCLWGGGSVSQQKLGGSLALAPLDQRNCPVLPDVVGGAEAGSLPAQPGQHEPALTLHPHQLRVTQHLLHQLLVPPDARGRILWQEGGLENCLTWGLTWGLSQHRMGTWCCRGDREQPRGQEQPVWEQLCQVLGNWSEMLLWLHCRWALWECPQPVVLPPLLPVSLPARRCSAAPGCSAAAAPMPA